MTGGSKWSALKRNSAWPLTWNNQPLICWYFDIRRKILPNQVKTKYVYTKPKSCVMLCLPKLPSHTGHSGHRNQQTPRTILHLKQQSSLLSSSPSLFEMQALRMLILHFFSLMKGSLLLSERLDRPRRTQTLIILLVSKINKLQLNEQSKARIEIQYRGRNSLRTYLRCINNAPFLHI